MVGRCFINAFLLMLCVTINSVDMDDRSDSLMRVLYINKSIGICLGVCGVDMLMFVFISNSSNCVVFCLFNRPHFVTVVAVLRLFSFLWSLSRLLAVVVAEITSQRCL